MKFDLVTPTRSLVCGQEIEELFVPAFRGELNILPGHAPLVSVLTEGVLRYRLKGRSQPEVVALSWGYLEVTPQGVQVLAETAELPKDIDIHRAKSALRRAEEALSQSDITPEDIEKYQKKVRRAQARMDTHQI